MGRFQIASLQSKTYSLRVFMQLRDLVGEGPEADLRSRDEISGLEIGVSLEHPDRAVVAGSVTRGDEYVAGQLIQVQYDPIRREGTEDIVPRGSLSATTTTKGQYILKEMIEGTAAVTLIDMVGFGRLTQFVDLEPGESYVVDFDVPVNANGGIEGWIDPPPRGEGTVVRAYTDNRDGVSVQWTARSTGEGYYRFFGLPAGVFEVTVEPHVDGVRPELPPGVQGAMLRIAAGWDVVIRVTSGLWTQLYLGLPYRQDVGPEGWIYPPRQYFASYADAVAQSTAEFAVNGNYGSDFVTVDVDTISRLDFDFGGRDTP